MTNLKKAAITSIILLLWLIGMAIISLAENKGVVTEEAKLRKTASDNSIVLEIIPNKEEVEILEEQENWYKVKYNKIKGYVLKDFIKVEENSAETNTVQENNQITNENQEESVALEKGDIALTNKEDKIYVRPLINSLVASDIKKDEEVTIMTIINNWAYISSDTVNGWIMLESLTKKTDTKTNKEEDKTSEELNKTVYISSTGVNFRKEANTDSEILKVFTENTTVTLLSEDEQWCKIKYKDQVGYVNKNYVSDKKVEVTSRSSSTRAQTKTTKNVEQSQTTTKKENSQTTNTKTSAKGQEVANYAKQFVGCKYVYGGSNPSKGFDCSGLTMYVYSKFGISLPHSATAQSKKGTTVSRANLQPGDLIFFTNYSTGKGIGHVGIYIGSNKFVHASTEKTGVIISSLSGSHSSRYVTATRLVNN